MLEISDEDQRAIAGGAKAVRILTAEYGYTDEQAFTTFIAMQATDKYKESAFANWWDVKTLLGETEEMQSRIMGAVSDAQYYAPNLGLGLVKMNTYHAVVSVAGKTRIITEGDPHLSHPADFHNLYRGKNVPIDGKPKPISHLWMNSPDRQTYSEAAFLPGIQTRPDVYNFWRGWAVEPNSEASCELFLAHIYDTLCGGDGEAALYLVYWLAHIVQRPQEKPGVAVVMKGAKGVGKDTVADYFACAIGTQYVPVIDKTEHLTGRFTAHLETALLANVQEAVWAGSRRDEGALKSLITAPTQTVERKGIDAQSSRSFVRVLITSNADWVVPASNDERRWFVLDIKSKKREPDYYRALRNEMDGDGPAALLHFLMSLDLSEFDVRDVPQTSGLMGQKLSSLRNIERWWFELLCNETLPGVMPDVDFVWDESGTAIKCDTLRQSYSAWISENQFQGEKLSQVQFGHRLKAMCPDITRTRPRTSDGRQWEYQLPDLRACKLAFEDWVGSPLQWEGDL